MRPIAIRGDLALWYSPDDRATIGKRARGWGEKTSRVYRTQRGALRAYDRCMREFRIPNLTLGQHCGMV